MEFLPLSRRHSSARNVPSGKERGETDVFAGYPKLQGIDYVAKNWALAMMLKALPLVHFWSILLLKEQNDDLCQKNIKNPGLISAKPIDF